MTAPTSPQYLAPAILRNIAKRLARRLATCHAEGGDPDREVADFLATGRAKGWHVDGQHRTLNRSQIQDVCQRATDIYEEEIYG